MARHRNARLHPAQWADSRARGGRRWWWRWVTDPEVVRDTIGAALVGVGVISVAVNDAADTIAISSTATANTAATNAEATTGTDAAKFITPASLKWTLDARSYSTALAGTTFTIVYNGTAWPARPSSRADLIWHWVDYLGTSSAPPGAIAGSDQYIKDSGA